MQIKKRVFALLTVLILLFSAATPAMATEVVKSGETARRVQEIESLRETNSETYLMSDGSYECVVYADNKYFVDESNNLQLIDNTIRKASHTTSIGKTSDESGVLYKNTANAFDVYFSNNNSQEISVQYNEKSITFSPLKTTSTHKQNMHKNVSSLTIGSVENCVPLNQLTSTGNNTVTYTNAFENTDLVYVLENNALKEYIILNNDSAPNTFNFIFSLNGIAMETANGTAHFTTPDGLTIFTLNSLFALDANGVYTENINYSFTPVADTNNVVVTITLDENYKSASDRVFPIVIDPTIMVSSSETADACVCSAFPNTNYKMATQLRTGYDSDYGIRRSYLKFNIPNSIPVAGVTRATLDIEKLSGVAPTMKAYMCSTSWSSGSLTWNNQPSVMSTYQSSVSVPFATGSTWYTMDVTSIVQAWVNGNFPNYGFMVKDNTESNINHWTTLYSSDAASPHKPELIITYNGGSYQYSHYYDSSFSSARQNQIAAVVSATSSAYYKQFRISFTTKGTPQLNTILTAGTHKDVINISNTLNAFSREYNEIKVLWTDHSYGTYCSHRDGTCKDFDALAAVYLNRPVIHILNLLPDGGSTAYYEACMALLLMHETAHTFGLGDSFNEDDVVVTHNASGMQCVMEALQEGSPADTFYKKIKNGENAFCETCKNNLITEMS